MAVEVALDSPLAKQLQNDVHLKAVDQGWAGSDDSGLSEYIVLMLVNGKSQAEVASELSTDLLDVSPDDPAVGDFTRWLFEQVNVISSQQNGGAPASEAPQPESTDMGDSDMQGTMDAPSGPAADGQDVQANGSMFVSPTCRCQTQANCHRRPTGPKSMRDGGNRGRGGRMGMMGNGNRPSNRPNDAGMHRIKGAANRINSHTTTTPRGPTPKGPRGALRQGASSGRMQNAMQSQLNAMTGQNSGITPFTPEQQMQMIAMQQQMMASIMTPEQQQAFMASMGGSGMASGQQGRHGGQFNKRQNGGFKQNGDTDAMDLTSSMEMNDSSQNQRPDPSNTVCRFNAYCTKPDCPFAHQSPAAPGETSIDMNDTCSFGAACTNRKCVGKHPSPAVRAEHAASAQCRYWPNCTNRWCTFAHPTTQLCRNGADCKTPDCKFTHPTIECKYNPCLNPQCAYKHAEGQKRGKFQDKVWVNPENGDGQQKEEHVSERKFVDETAKEELVLPGHPSEESKTEDMAVAT